MAEPIKSRIADLNSALSRHGEAVNQKVYRAIDADALGGRDSLTKGRRLADPAFLSATKTKRGAYSFIHDQGSFDGGDPVVFEIDPNGHVGLDVDRHIAANESRYHGEKEVLFGQNKKLHITGQGEPIYDPESEMHVPVYQARML